MNLDGRIAAALTSGWMALLDARTDGIEPRVFDEVYGWVQESIIFDDEGHDLIKDLIG